MVAGDQEGSHREGSNKGAKRPSVNRNFTTIDVFLYWAVCPEQSWLRTKMQQSTSSSMSSSKATAAPTQEIQATRAIGAPATSSQGEAPKKAPTIAGTEEENKRPIGFAIQQKTTPDTNGAITVSSKPG